ncbi:hypothetical protein [Marinilabilia salmonicolor]|uniref:Lipoprotein n=1 Tax=Marinilabilia salmonicolor TaxID=989 RepID=A0A368V679_9BACT|nr:hypothetical protein [Marinilabilia salmonicolor]RCW36592.1 hypothetical protein DFO77_10834 [Marinilabilia salmonicolor]
MKKFIVFLTCLVFVSCSEELNFNDSIPDPSLNSSTLKSQSLSFDWENEEYVSGDPLLPRLPWKSMASTAVPRELALDIKSEDGWRLLFNSFTMDDGHPEPNKFLMFYNKFRGILRFWYYHEGVSSYSDLRYGLQLTGSTSLLNFVGDFAKPMDKRRSNDYTESISGDWGNLSIGQGLVENQWYLFDFTLAYDDNVPNLDVDENDLFFYLRGINISHIDLTGVQAGEITGDVIIDSKGQSNLFNIGGIKIDNSSVKKDFGNNNFIDTGATATANSKEPQSWWSLVGPQLSQKTAEAVGNAGGALVSDFLNLTLNPVQNLVNSLIHQGNTSNNGYVDLKMSTSIDLSGIVTEQEPVQVTNLYVPGSIYQSGGSKYIDNEDVPLGVFNLSTTPTIRYKQIYSPVQSYKGNFKYCQFFSLDRNSFDIKINPEIQDDIVVIKKKAELYFYDLYSGPTNLNRCSLFPPYATDVAGDELVNDSEGNRWFKLIEGFDSPYNSCDEYGISNYTYFDVSNGQYPTLKKEADGRIVVKVMVQFINKESGKVVTHIQTYLPQFIENNQWWPLYY